MPSNPLGKRVIPWSTIVNGLMKFHPNPEIVDFDLRQWRDKLPDFWKIFEKTFDGSSSSGYYDWLDVDGSIRRKFMSIVPVRDSMFMVAATTYIDEFSIPVKETKTRIDATTQQIKEHVNETLDDIYRNFFAFLLFLMVVVLGVAVFISRTITRPVLSLIRGVKAIGRGEIDHRVEVQTGDEMEELAAAFNRMTMDLQDHMVGTEADHGGREGLLKELEIARGIQQRLIPDRAPRIPRIDLAANNIPAREVGGDFYDFIPVRDDLWGVVIADVSGKECRRPCSWGCPGLWSGPAPQERSTWHTPSAGNELICRESTSGMFRHSFLCGRRTGSETPVCERRSQPSAPAAKGGGRAGLSEGPRHRPRVKKGYSTGGNRASLRMTIWWFSIPTASQKRSTKRPAFRPRATDPGGSERPGSVRRRNHHENPDAVIAFAGGRPQFDDIALVVLKVL